MSDDFNGDNAHLIDCIKVLVEMSDAGALVPHGIGGHARGLLLAAANRLTPASSGAVSREAVVAEDCARWHELKAREYRAAHKGEHASTHEKWAAAILALLPTPSAVVGESSSTEHKASEQMVAELCEALGDLLSDAERVGVEGGLADQIDPDIYEKACAVYQAAKAQGAAR